jgi:hypothetical protein
MQQPRMSRYMKHVLASPLAAFGRLKEVGLPKWKALIKTAIQFVRRISVTVTFLVDLIAFFRKINFVNS